MGTKQVLVVDDDAEIRNALADLFRMEGYRVTTATNGQGALMILDGVEFDALLVDLSMPIMDGFALRRVLRERGSPIPFIVMTAARHQPAELDHELRATAYLFKPFDFDEVLATVDRAVREAQSCARSSVR